MSKINEKEKLSISDYFNLYRKLKNSKNFGKNKKSIKIALLSSFTANGIKEVLFVKCHELGIYCDFYVGKYSRYSQEILDKNSGLHKFEPDLIIWFVDIMSIFGSNYFLPYSLNENQRKKLIEEKLNEIRSLAEKLKSDSDAKILLHNFEVPLFSPLGILESKQKFGFIESVEALNSKLRDTFKNDDQVFVFDYNAFCSKIGKDNAMDYKMYYLGDIKFDLQYLPELCSEYMVYIKPMVSITKKCIVLDLDNTLWGGIIGEDGLEGIKLGPTPEGRPFMEFQQYLLSLFNRGVILAINSRNNYDDAMEVFKKHPNMVLKENNFAAMQINWNDKIANMKAIAEELNIGTDSLVFIDDDKSNRQMIREAFPEINVVEMPEDPSLYLKTLMDMNDFNILQITEEDKKRGRMYVQQRKRTEFQKSTSNLTEFLKSLNMVVTAERANKFNIPRIAQLTQKTNQFNMTTKRYMEEDIKKFSEDKNYHVFSVRVEDKFGDNGITGAAIIKKGKDIWSIGTFLLSCRIVGRKVEETLLAYIAKEAKKAGAKRITADFIPTEKNSVANDFYKNSGFSLVKKEKSKEVWEYSLKNDYKFPNFIKFVEKQMNSLKNAKS
ncbi:HAD-IIIC family phosphatase [Candidatus Woesearchaeota archaeon]|nr:HAD-IIIC family phosphatase [Candidatus Woesearchaeota archaeon]